MYLCIYVSMYLCIYAGQRILNGHSTSIPGAVTTGTMGNIHGTHLTGPGAVSRLRGTMTSSVGGGDMRRNTSSAGLTRSHTVVSRTRHSTHDPTVTGTGTIAGQRLLNSHSTSIPGAVTAGTMGNTHGTHLTGTSDATAGSIRNNNRQHLTSDIVTRTLDNSQSSE